MTRSILAASEFEILVAGYFSRESVAVHYTSPGTVPRSPEEYAQIERIWDERLSECRKAGIPLYNGILFRLLGYEVSDKHLSLDVGNTTYKEYVGTRTPSYSKSHSRTNLANPLAVCAVVCTSDGKILIARRVNSDIYSGRYHVIGGFTDRDRDFDGRTLDPFAAIAREVREETGLPLHPSAFTCTGLVYDVLTPHPELCFVVQTVESLHVRKSLERGDGEVHALEFIENSPESLENFIRSNHGRISATGEPSLLLYGLHSFGEHWFKSVSRFTT